MALLVGAGLTPGEARALLAPEQAREPVALPRACDLLARSGRTCPGN
jgi:hypothetical protein